MPKRPGQAAYMKRAQDAMQLTLRGCNPALVRARGVRCPGCGGYVLPPCRLCAVRAAVSEPPSSGREPTATSR